MSVFLTADTHFGRASIIRNCDRPFVSTQAMDECLIGNRNADERVEELCAWLMEKSSTYAGRQGGLRYRQQQAGRRRWP